MRAFYGYQAQSLWYNETVLQMYFHIELKQYIIMLIYLYFSCVINAVTIL